MTLEFSNYFSLTYHMFRSINSITHDCVYNKGVKKLGNINTNKYADKYSSQYEFSYRGSCDVNAWESCISLVDLSAV